MFCQLVVFFSINSPLRSRFELKLCRYFSTHTNGRASLKGSRAWIIRSKRCVIRVTKKGWNKCGLGTGDIGEGVDERGVGPAVGRERGSST